MNTLEQMKPRVILDGKYAIVNGKKGLVKDYFARVAIGLPKIYNTETGEYLEHYKELQVAYKEGGVKRYNEYLKAIRKIKLKNYSLSKRIWIYLRSFFM